MCKIVMLILTLNFAVLLILKSVPVLKNDKLFRFKMLYEGRLLVYDVEFTEERFIT